MTGSAKIEIVDCVFEQVHLQSIVVERSRELEMVGNQFGGSAVQILSYRDTSSAIIRCNRVMGSVIRHGCNRTMATIPNNHTIPSKVYTRYQYRTVEELRAVGEEGEGDWLVIFFGVVLLCSIGIYTSYVGYNNWKIFVKLKNGVLAQFRDLIGVGVSNIVEEQTIHKETTVPEPPPPPDSQKVESSLKSSNTKSASGRTQVMTPVWLNEIQNNEIFNKQKKISLDSNKKESEGTEDRDKSQQEERVKNGLTFQKGCKEYVY